MYGKVLTFFEEDGAVLYPLVPGLEHNVEALAALHEGIPEKDEMATQTTEGFTTDKVQDRQLLAQQGRRTAGVLVLYFKDQGNEAKRARYKVLPSQWDTFNDAELVKKCVALQKEATTLGVAALATYNGYAATDLAALGSALDGFLNSQPLPREKVAEKVSYGILVDRDFEAADALLLEMDEQMEVVEGTHAQQYLEYRSARKKDNLTGGGSGSGQVTYTGPVLGGQTVVAGTVAGRAADEPLLLQNLTATAGTFTFMLMNGETLVGSITLNSATTQNTVLGAFGGTGTEIRVKNNSTEDGDYKVVVG